MIIAPVLLKRFFLNSEQRSIVAHKEGPLLVIAGPGSGKTRSLLLLALNLLMCGNAQPEELVLCTYTEQAASEVRDRLIQYAREMDYVCDFSRLRIGTIHSICKQLIVENVHATPVESDFTTLDEFEQQLLIFEHLDMLCPAHSLPFFMSFWGSRWSVAKMLGSSFNKIAEDLLFEQLKSVYGRTSAASWQTDADKMRYLLTYAYRKYQTLLRQRNCLDFSHLQKCAYNLLHDSNVAPRILENLRYVLVDEYQDTNYIQEQILRQLVSRTKTHNLCVVGDEDQALYRFRGATVRNILEFAQTFPSCTQLRLLTNYRSSARIIDTYNTWMTTIDWSNAAGLVPFRTAKSVLPAPNTAPSQHVAAYAVCYQSVEEEAEQFAQLVLALKAQGKISDYSQVALLLRSVRPDFSDPYRRALDQAHIPYYCPRARSYFQQDDIRLLIGCYARILHYPLPAAREAARESEEADALLFYLEECEQAVQFAYGRYPYLLPLLQHMQHELASTADQLQSKGQTLLDYFYRLLTVKPFLDTIKAMDEHEQQVHNLERFSQLLRVFQDAYAFEGLTVRNLKEVVRAFFQHFLSALFVDGLNLLEDREQQLPGNRVPILTIHQAKGLEFPVVVVGRLDKSWARQDLNLHKELQAFSSLRPFEPEQRIPGFDHRRLYYVAFSRAKNLLLLTAAKVPDRYMRPLCQGLPVWQHRHVSLLPEAEQYTSPVPRQARYGLTSHVQYYQTCPRQYQFFRHHAFVPGTQREYLAGTLIHQMLEHIHHVALTGKIAELTTAELSETFEQKYRVLQQVRRSSLDKTQKEQAWSQVQRYFEQNQDMLRTELATELPVHSYHSAYLLTGKVDLLVKATQGSILIDFKTQPRPEQDDPLLQRYRQQLYFYAHALERTSNQRPRRLYLYWTAEQQRADALVEVPYNDELRADVDLDLQEAIDNIQHQRFHVRRPPAAFICKSCDLRHLCRQEHIIA